MTARTLFITLIAGLSVAFVATARAAEVTLRAASFQPERVVFAKHFFRWVRETNKRCAGKIKIGVIDAGAIAARHQWHALRSGRIDMYFGPANYYRGVVPKADVLNLAHKAPAELRRNGVWATLNALHNKNMNAWYLTTLIAGVKFFVYTTKPAKDGRFDGLRLRSVPLYDIFLRSRGARTRYMAAPALRAALEKGAIDGYGWPLWGLDIFGWDKFTKYRYGPGFLNTAAPVLVNLDKWKSLDDGQRKCLTDMALWLEAEWPKWLAAENAIQLAALKKAGIAYVDLGADFARRAESVIWNMIKAADPAFARKMKPLMGAAD